MSSNSAIIKTNSFGNNSLFGIILIGIVVLIIIMFVYNSYVGYKNYQKYSPYLVDGIIDATVAQKYSAYQIQPPSDSANGTEFTYSFWIFIKDVNFAAATTSGCNENTPLLHVFHKGSYDYIPNGSQSGAQTPGSGVYYPLLQMPGVWLYPNTNKLNIRFNTYENIVETSDIGNVPLNMWVNVIIILIGSSVDIYVNGNLKKRTKLSGVPKINYGDFYVTNWGGFQGYLSKLRYFNYAIQPFLVDQIFSSGPSTTFSTTTTTNTLTTGPPQLSQNYWMTTGYPNSTGFPGYNKK